MPGQYKKYRILFITALTARLLFFILVKPWEPFVQENIILQSDAKSYHLLATHLLSQNEFVNESGAPESLRTPLYPLFLSLSYFLFGQNPVIPIIFQIILDCISCVLLFHIIKKYTTANIAFISSLFYALDPYLIFFSVTLLSETLFIFILITATLFLTGSMQSHSQKYFYIYITLAGCFFGLATLVRPISLYLVIVIPLFLLLVKRKSFKPVLIGAAVFITAFCLSVLPWGIRNINTFGTLSLSTSGSFNLLALYVSPFEAARRNQPTEIVKQSLLNEADSLMVKDGFVISSMNDFQKAKYWNDLSFKYIQNNFREFLKYSVIGISHSFMNLGTRGFADMLQLPHREERFEIKGKENLILQFRDFMKQKSVYEISIALIVLMFLLLQYTCLITGVIASWKVVSKSYLWFSLIMTAYFILLTGAAGLVRFRLPAIPFYLVFAGAGGEYLFHKIKQLVNRRKIEL